MKHRIKGKTFNRNTHQRKALFRSLIQNFIIHEEIKTTASKAKVIKRLVDKLIAKAKTGTLQVRRQLMAFLPNKKAVNKLVDEIAPRVKQRTSGFTRFMRLGKRRGDDAMIVKMELVEKSNTKTLKGQRTQKSQSSQKTSVSSVLQKKHSK